MSLRRSYPAIILLALVAIIWATAPLGRTSGEYTDAATPGVAVELARPPLAISGAAADAGTAFREEDAGFSAAYRVPAPPATADATTTAQPRLDIDAITKELTEPLDQNDPIEQSNTVRVHGRPGVVVNRGVNFGTVTIPMLSAFGQPMAAPRDVTVYYDAIGWIVAYLPAGEPAAAIWRHKSAPGDTYPNPTPDAHLEHNLLILAINEALRASDAEAAPVTHAMVDYYHWEYPDCNAFMLFSNKTTTRDGTGHRIKFVIPPTISDIQASAAALIASGPIGGESTVAKVMIDNTVVATAPAPDYLSVSKFDLARDESETSVHRMTISVDERKSAAGVIMLLYHKPAS